MNKKELREKYIAIRKKIIDKEAKSKIIFEKVINLDIYKNSKIIGIYHSTSDEVFTLDLIDYSLSLGKVVCLPRVIDKNNIEFCQITNRFKLVESNYKILEPANDDVINPKTIDLMIVPGIVFSKDLYRIGYGMGYYDKYLVKTAAFKIGLSFKETLIKEVEHDENDVKLDQIITD